MAWIAGLADKAENILNKLDQNAATALQVPTTGAAGETNTLDAMRRSLSNSTLSLKTALSPTKLRTSGSSSTGNSRAGSVKNDGGTITPAMTDSVESNGKLDWSVGADTAASSRRGSTHSRADSVTIDVEDTLVQKQQINNKYDQFKQLATEATIAKALTTSTTPMESQELAAFKIALNEVISERDELRTRLLTLNREAANDTSWQRIQELEALLQRLTEERDQAQHELSDIQTTNNAYVHSISELETQLANLQQEYVELAQKLQMQLKESEHQRKELQDYRIKAQLALQMKDNLIAELKASGSVASSATSHNDESELRVLQMEFDTLKQEQQQTLEECGSLRMQLEVLQREWNALSEHHATQLAAVRANEEALRKELRSERENLLATESEQRMQTQELAKLRQQLSNQMAASATRLQEKEQQLRAEYARRGGANMAAGMDVNATVDHDVRIKTLTQTLVDKQQTVERITAERNALRLQLEKMQDQLQRSMLYSSDVSTNSGLPRNALLSNSTDDVKAQFPLLMRANPFDNRVARRVKRVYSSLDSAGIRLGAFLRRYPLMRVFVLMYVALLHIWVMFVLLSSTPN